LIGYLPKKKNHFEAGFKEKVTEENKDIDNDEDEKPEPKEKLDKTEKDFDYLLGMKLWNLTWEKVEELKKQVEDARIEIDVLLATAPEDLWERDLDVFLKVWLQFSSDMNFFENNPTAKKGKKAKLPNGYYKGLKPLRGREGLLKEKPEVLEGSKVSKAGRTPGDSKKTILTRNKKSTTSESSKSKSSSSKKKSKSSTKKRSKSSSSSNSTSNSAKSSKISRSGGSSVSDKKKKKIYLVHLLL